MNRKCLQLTAVREKSAALIKSGIPTKSFYSFKPS